MELLQPAPAAPVVRRTGRRRDQLQVAVRLGEGALGGAEQARAQRVHLVEQVERLRERGRARAQHRASAVTHEAENRGRLRGVPAVAPRRAQRVRLVNHDGAPSRGAQPALQPRRHLERNHHDPRPLRFAPRARSRRRGNLRS